MKQGSVKVARRYAKALVSLCDERGDGEAVRTQLQAIATALAEVAEAQAILANPSVSLEQRRSVLGVVTQACGVAGTAKDTVNLLLDKGRIGSLSDISKEFAALQDARSGRTQATVTSAVALSEAAKAHVQDLMTRLLGKQVALDAQVDAGLLGGLVVRVGNTVYDASVSNHLARLRQNLLAD